MSRLAKEYLGVRRGVLPEGVLELSPVLDSDEEPDLHRWTAVIEGPALSPYAGGRFALSIAVPESYPSAPPTVNFSTTVVHPNIHPSTGEVCLSVLHTGPGGWLPAWDLVHVVMAVVQLMTDPEPDLPLNIDAANLVRYDTVAYESLVRYYTARYACCSNDH